MDKFLDLFLETLIYEKNYSINTIKAYKKDIIAFQGFLESHEGVLSDISPIFVSEWLEQLSVKGLAPRSITRKLSVLRSFFNFMVQQNIITKNPFLVFSSVKSTKKIPTTLSIKEMKEVLFKMPEKTILQRRNKAIFLLLYTTGIRSEELCSLSCQDVLFSQGVIRVLGKGKKERLVPLLPITKEALKIWIKEDRVDLDNGESTSLFLSYRGFALTTSMIRKLTKAMSQNLTKRFHPHAFRYTFASHLLEEGANLRHIQELLGHGNLSVTERYTKISIHNLKTKYYQFHPRA